MEKKQTAIEWLKDQYMKADGITEPLKVLLAFEDALEMEKEQIIKAFNNGEANVWDRVRDENHFEFEGGSDYFEKYYKTLNDWI
jgi:hypothetical protein